MTPALAVAGLEVELGGRTVLCGVDLSVAVGERVALMGTSGSGKTTLVRAVAGLQPAIAGTIALGGREVSRGARSLVPPPSRRISLVFQDLALWPHMTAMQHLRFVIGERGLARAEVDERARAALDDVGLAGHGGSRPAELSGGERQRLALARALVTQPDLLVLDEPFGSLDLPLKLGMMELLLRRQRVGGFAVLHVTHDPFDALRTASRIVLLEAGGVAFDGPVGELAGGRAPALADLATALRGALAVLSGSETAGG